MWRMDMKRQSRARWAGILIDAGMSLCKSFLLAGLSGCLMLTGLAGPVRAQTPMSAQDPLPALIAARLAQAGTAGMSGEGLALLRLVYARGGNRPLWTRVERLRELVVAIENSREDGLEPADYRLEWLRRIVAEPTTDPALLAERDLLLSDTLATLVRHLAEGRLDPHRHHALWNYSPPPDVRGQADRLQLLFESAPLAATVARQAPQLAEYRQLKAGLARYRRLAAAGGWSVLAPGPTLHPGEYSARVPALRARLQAGGEPDGRAVADPELFDQALSEALMRFQRAHGLAVDGVAGPATWQALNVGVEERIAQIVINLERLRWLARDLSGDHLRVDIAGYQALLHVGGQPGWQGRVIVGRPLRQTPVLRDRLRRIVLNPRWVVPPTILRQDVIPAMRRNPAYLHEHRLRIVDARGQPVDPASVMPPPPGLAPWPTTTSIASALRRSSGFMP